MMAANSIRRPPHFVRATMPMASFTSQEPTPVGDCFVYKHPPPSMILSLEPTLWAMACHGGEREIAHRGGLYKKAILLTVFKTSRGRINKAADRDSTHKRTWLDSSLESLQPPSSVGAAPWK